MKRITLTLLLLLAASASARMGVSNGYDLDALWARAADYELDTLDAVLLLEQRDVTLEGRHRTTHVHRVVWIGTRAGLGAHADLRVPWNSDFATLEVKKLRTWRDGRWWPGADVVSPTAVVETLPYAVAHAYDYAGLRETMLLHDGVELPCIMETEYVIFEQGVAPGGDDGCFVFPQNDPSVRTVFSVTSNRAPVRAVEHNGVSAAAVSGTTRTWTLEDVPRLRLPHTGDPAAYEPCVRWSTWESWDAAGEQYVREFDQPAVLDDATRAELDERLEGCLSDYEKLLAVNALVDETVADVHYDAGYWGPNLRTAARVRETGYAHARDRLVLVLALLKAADLMPQPAFELTTRGAFDPEVPGLHGWTGLQLKVNRVGPGLLLDPASGAVTAVRDLDRRVRWDPLWDDAPELVGDHRFPTTTIDRDDPAAKPIDPDDMEILAEPALLRLRLDLAAAESGWTGRGAVDAEHALSPWARAAGADGELDATLDALTTSVLAGAETTGRGVLRFEPTVLEATMTFTLAEPEPDARGRLELVIGDPDGGLLTLLPHDVDPAREHRESPVLLTSHPAQVITVHLETGGRTVVAAPEPVDLENSAGRYHVRVTRADDAIEVERWLSLHPGPLPAADWPALRALLLEEADPIHRTVLLK